MSQTQNEEPVIYHNGCIRTCAQPPTVQALAVCGPRIAAAGDFSALRRQFPNARLCDLHGSALLPAFVDAHSHFSQVASGFLQADLSGAQSLSQVQACIERYMRQNRIGPGQWVRCTGYDHNRFTPKQHPTAAFLDAFLPRNPCVLQHQSGHVGVLNTAALQALGLDAATADPPGGRFGRNADGSLTGFMEESANLNTLQRIPLPSPEKLLDAYEKAQQYYAEFGIVTVQEGMMVESMLPLYQTLVRQNRLRLRVVWYPGWQDYDAFARTFPDAVKGWQNNFHIGGVKVFLDGSPQAQTAWMRTPYGDKNSCGYGTMSDEQLQAALEFAAKRGLQVLAHCNGDAACAQFLALTEQTQKKYPDFAKCRCVLIHAQLLGLDQLEKVRQLSLIPSFFAAHVYFWGETHLQSFGLKRAQHISPAGSALRQGIRFTFHQDSPVLPPDMLRTLQCAVTRRTQQGRVLGQDEAIDISSALQAVTVNAAFQYFAENDFGSLRPGFAADFVCLSGDPAATPPEELTTLSVRCTVKNGEILYGAL